MTLSSSINPASGCTIPTGKDEVSLYLHGSEELDLNAALAWWHRCMILFDSKFPLLLEVALQHVWMTSNSLHLFYYRLSTLHAWDDFIVS
ncbi:hypothetical protein L208DRAFT_1330794 [Tricholoma matsutake]|nr:hypothetical protein L208DRAFT_1330794 [Tricholoma matsutake 945]